jgi:putative ABC transport system permease protein
MMLSLQFAVWIMIRVAIAWPLAYFVMNGWLQNFAYRTSIDPWIFILSALLALVMAVLTVSLQAFKSGTANPVDSVRYE